VRKIDMNKKSFFTVLSFFVFAAFAFGAIPGDAKVNGKYYLSKWLDDSQTFSNAVSDINGLDVQAVLVIDSDASLSQSETIDKEVTLEFVSGCKITVSSSYDLTLNGPIDAGAFLIFDAVLSSYVTNVKINNSPYILTEWFGAEANDSTICTDAIKEAIGCAADSSTKHIKLLSGTYLINASISIDQASHSGLSFTGNGYDTELKCASAASGTLLLYINATYVDIEGLAFSNLRFNGNDVSNSQGIYFTQGANGTDNTTATKRITLNTIWAHDCGKTGVYLGADDIIASNIYSWDNGIHGVACKQGKKILSNIVSINNAGHGLDISYDSDVTVNNIQCSYNNYGMKTAIDSSKTNGTIVKLKMTNAVFSHNDYYGVGQSIAGSLTTTEDIQLMFDNIECHNNGATGFGPGSGVKTIGKVISHDNSSDGVVLAAPATAQTIISYDNAGTANARGLFTSGTGDIYINTLISKNNSATGQSQGVWVNNNGCNVFIDSGQIVDNKHYAAAVYGGGLTMKNVYIDYTTTCGVDYGITTTGDAMVSLEACEIGSGVVNPIVKNNNAKFRFVDNIGLVTTASGAAVVASGTTNVLVTHGVKEIYLHQVLPENIQITPTNLLGNASKWQVTRYDANRFQITVDADPGASTATFSWRVKIGDQFK